MAGAISRYPRLPVGVTHAKRGAKHSAARCRVCEWQTRAGVVLVVYIAHHPSVAARQPGLREQSIAPGKLSSCQSSSHSVSPWVFPATPSDRPRDAVSPIARSSPPLLAIPNFSTASLKMPCRRTDSCARFDSDIDAGGAREEALSRFPGSSCKSVQGLPGTSFCGTSEHAKGSRCG